VAKQRFDSYASPPALTLRFGATLSLTGIAQSPTHFHTHTPASLAGAKAAVIMLGVVADIFEEING
jgi:hypothetical protein